jgi:hypothetical protein
MAKRRAEKIATGKGKSEKKYEKKADEDELQPKKHVLKRGDPAPREEFPEPHDVEKEHRAAMKKNLASRISGQYHTLKKEKYSMVKPFYSE